MLTNLISIILKIFKPKRKQFGTWVKLETISLDIEKSIETNNTKFPEFVIEYVSTALPIPKAILAKIAWYETLYLFYYAKKLNIPSKIPLLLEKAGSKEKDKPVGWDYRGRIVHHWSHILAKEYGWGLEYISGLDVDVALAHIQEIFTDEQLDREFLWSMSEIAYPYNSTTKKSNFSPLQRPYFMVGPPPELKRFKISRNFLPQGVVNDTGGMEKFIQETKESKSSESE